MTARLHTLPISEATTLRDLDRCKLFVACQGRCRQIARLPVPPLIARFGLDAKLIDLAPKLRCTRCGAFGHPTVERLTGIYRPVGDEPHYC